MSRVSVAHSSLILSMISYSSMSQVKWVPNTSFNLPWNFDGNKLPCSKQNVVFPDSLMQSVKIEFGISAKSLILPKDGELILDGTVILGEDSTDKVCTEDVDAYFTENLVFTWAQPDVWSSTKFNKATPDAERVPCYDDTVVFPDNAQFAILLPQETQQVKELIVSGKSYSTEEFEEHVAGLTDEVQQFVYNFNQEVGVDVGDKQCYSRAGCPCQSNVLKIECGKKFCRKPECEHPIKPIGNCCYICGGAIYFDVDEEFDMIAFKKQVAKIVDEHEEKLVYHIGRLPPNKVQLVVVDKNNYTYASTEVVNEVDYALQKLIKGFRLTQISGTRFDDVGSTVRIFIITFLTIVLVLGGLYIYYYKNNARCPYVRNSNFGFVTRFDRRTESVVSLTRRDLDIPVSNRPSGAFRNPLYDSKKERVRIMETELEE